MNFKLFSKKNIIPKALFDFLDGGKIRSININHISGDYVYSVDNEYILKISKNKERLKREKVANDYLINKLPVSQSVLYLEDDNYSYYVKTKLKGTSLVSSKYLKNPLKLAKLLAKAIKMFHDATDSNCPLINLNSKGHVLVHGDFCLPNILVKNNKISGFIDLEASGLGDPWEDYAWCIWSFEYNLKTNEYTPILLKELDIEFDLKKFKEHTNI